MQNNTEKVRSLVSSTDMSLWLHAYAFLSCGLWATIFLLLLLHHRSDFYRLASRPTTVSMFCRLEMRVRVGRHTMCDCVASCWVTGKNHLSQTNRSSDRDSSTVRFFSVPELLPTPPSTTTCVHACYSLMKIRYWGRYIIMGTLLGYYRFKNKVLKSVLK
jgi:hypothetical protein